MSRTAIISINDANTKGWRTLAGPDGPGCLKGVGAVQAQQGRHRVKIQIDGRTVVSGLISSCGHDCENSGMSLDLPFYDQLTVEIQNVDNAIPDTKFWASYVLGTDA